MHFRPTRWSLIARAGSGAGEASRHALGELYNLYSYPLYVYVRRRGIDAADAADLIHGFFAKLLDDSLLAKADPHKGRFRSYLLGALKHFLSDEWDRSRALKRGGGIAHVSLGDAAEERYGLEPRDEVTPEQLYERNWALTVLDRALERLRDEAARLGRGDQFDRLKELIPGPLPDRSYAEVAAELGTTEGAVKVALHRLRQRYRDVLTEQIAEMVESPDQADEEIRYLFAAVMVGNLFRHIS